MNPSSPQRLAPGRKGGGHRVDLFQKCHAYFRNSRPRDLQNAGVYPFFRPLTSGAGPEVVIDGHKLVMIGSNNYLGLTRHPKVIEASKRAVDKYGTSCTGSRFLNGTIDLHEELERRLAAFVRKEAALLFSTGYQVNLGVLSALVGKDDFVLVDRMDHASIFDGCRQSYGTTIKYKHNAMRELERACMTVDNGGGVLVAVDGVFSMEGDLVNLPRIVQLKEKYGYRIFLDDAHGIGVLGPGGRGTAEHFGLETETDLVMGTFSKAFASLGGFVAGPAEVIYHIKHNARALMFSASMTPSNVAAVLAVLDIVENEPEHRERLWENVRKMKRGFEQMGFPAGEALTPIIPIVVGEFEKVFAFWKALYDAGVYVNPVVSPAVPPDHGLLRTSYMATHTDEQLDRVLGAFEKIGRKLGVITSQSHARA